jgi:GT2 family glycosyltransferase
MKLFVIIVTFNAKKWIKKCLDSVLGSTVKAEIVVVDNCSDDDTISFIKEEYKNTIIFEMEKNLGFGRANNIGISYALKQGADYIYLLNQDAWVNPETFEILIDVQKKYPEYGVISPMHITGKGDKLDKNFVFCCNSTKDLISDLYFKTIKDVYETNFVNAAHWLISHDCIMTVGGFSPIFSHYGEDNDFINRIYFHGYKAGICPLTFAIHDRESREETWKKKMYQLFTGILIKLSDISPRNRKIKNNLYVIYLWGALFYYGFKFKSLLPLYYTNKIICSMPRIIRNKKIVKRDFPNYLDIKNIYEDSPK